MLRQTRLEPSQLGIVRLTNEDIVLHHHVSVFVRLNPRLSAAAALLYAHPLFRRHEQHIWKIGMPQQQFHTLLLQSSLGETEYHQIRFS